MYAIAMDVYEFVPFFMRGLFDKYGMKILIEYTLVSLLFASLDF